ncbi:hypothetical protein, partial [Acidocella sp. KAb 2-4]|uniref:hypothetical protein n=1 Tax=Acidocella sp. KAb 2-4 TaxID=2885158 RepID=UPI001D083BFE
SVHLPRAHGFVKFFGQGDSGLIQKVRFAYFCRMNHSRRLEVGLKLGEISRPFCPCSAEPRTILLKIAVKPKN